MKLIGNQVCVEVKESSMTIDRNPKVSDSLDFIYGELLGVDEIFTRVYINEFGKDEIKKIPNYKVLSINPINQ